MAQYEKNKEKVIWFKSYCCDTDRHWNYYST